MASLILVLVIVKQNSFIYPTEFDFILVSGYTAIHMFILGPQPFAEDWFGNTGLGMIRHVNV
jgi:hypothetical protein